MTLLTIAGRQRDLGGFSVARVIPAPQRRTVGPFIFFDEMGPADFPAGQGIDVRPHPHIGLATVTYLFAGGLTHRDSLGTVIDIAPGAVNWMTAGRGITHSERSPTGLRAAGHHMHGIQTWVALPVAHAETEPRFAHHPADTLPKLTGPGWHGTLIAGSAYGATAPVEELWPIFYVDAWLEGGTDLALPPEHEERAAYVVSGAITAAGERVESGTMAIFEPGAPAVITAGGPTHVMLLGGAALDGPRFIEWNFVSHSKDRIEQAKADWRAQAFPKVPDETEFIPLPEVPPPTPPVNYP